MARPLTIGIIPARYGSTRLPAKPLVDLCGKPMIQHVYERACASKRIDRVIVATDHWQIADVIARSGGEALMTPANLSSGSDRIAWVAERLADADLIVNIQGDEPLLRPSMIDAAIQPLHDDPSIQAGTLVCALTSPEELVDPNVVKAVLDSKGFALYFSRSPIPCLRDSSDKSGWTSKHHYYKHLGLYVFRRDILLQYSRWEATPLELAEKLEQLRLLEHGVRMKATVTEYDSIPVDTAGDAERVRAIMQANSKVKQP